MNPTTQVRQRHQEPNGHARAPIAKPRTKAKASSDDWVTPEWLAELLGHFDLDPCSNDKSHIDAWETCSLDHYEKRRRDGLAFDWERHSVFVNPPYSNVGPWAAKLVAHEGPWVALLKLDPTTAWWSTLMTATPTVAPFRRRIKFEGPQAMTANFPSVLVFSAWRPPADLRQHLWLPTYEARR